MDADAFLAEVEAAAARDAALSALEAAVLVALDAGIAPDTRTFAKVFGVAHALVLRAVSGLDRRFVIVTSRDPRTQRARLALTEAGRLLLGPNEKLAA